jgi:hypothetical protein
MHIKPSDHLREDPSAKPAGRVLLVGRECLSKDQHANLRRAGYPFVSADGTADGLAAISVISFDHAVIDVARLAVSEVSQLAESFHTRGMSGVAVIYDAGECGADLMDIHCELFARPVSLPRLIRYFRREYEV